MKHQVIYSNYLIINLHLPFHCSLVSEFDICVTQQYFNDHQFENSKMKSPLTSHIFLWPLFIGISTALYICLEYLTLTLYLGQLNLSSIILDNSQEVRLEKVLGVGQNGVVFKTTESPPNVIKIVLVPHSIIESFRKLAGLPTPQDEVQALHFMGDLRGEYWWNKRLVIKMKYHPGCTLRRCILDSNISTIEELEYFLYLAWQQIEFLHEKNMMHGDFHWGNVIYDTQYSSTNATTYTVPAAISTNRTRIIPTAFQSSTVNVHLIDFGLSIDVSEFPDSQKIQLYQSDFRNWNRTRTKSMKLLQKVMRKTVTKADLNDE